MRTGIFGGTFNPPHLGHKKALEAFIKSAELERVLIIPTYTPPHKTRPEKWAGFDERIEMCSLTFSDMGNECEIVFSDIEKRLFEATGEKSYTHLTLKKLFEDGERDLWMFVGTDMFLTLDSWVESAYILENTSICVMAREVGDEKKILRCKKRLEKIFKTKSIRIINDTPCPVSSTEIRNGGSELLDEKTLSYIKARGLYT